MIEVFKRKAWKRNKSYPGGYEPFVGRKTHVCVVGSVEEARRVCAEGNKDRQVKSDPFYEFTQI